jgi:FkbM family methyltransferase
MRGQKEVQRIEAMDMVRLMASGLIPANRREVAIDGGAHCGSFAVHMAEHFDYVHVFEPCAESFENLTHNCQPLPNVICHNQALMDKACMVEVYAPGRQTLTARQVKYGGNTPAIAIDDMHLMACDLLKLDLEGAEHLALLGAKKTIKKYHPFLLVEMNNLGKRFGWNDKQTEALIISMGYRHVWSAGVDRGYV